MKRIFVAIPISEELLEEVLKWGQKFQELHFKNQTNPNLQIINDKLKWIAPKNLHVTLAPPWETKEWKVESKKLKGIQFKPFEIKFDSVSFGPDAARPRMIWVTGQAGEEIKKLKESIETALNAGVDKKYYRTFYQHVTLARFRKEDFASFPTKVLNEKITWRQTVTSFALYESHLFPSGADYEVLEKFELGKK